MSRRAVMALGLVSALVSIVAIIFDLAVVSKAAKLAADGVIFVALVVVVLAYLKLRRSQDEPDS